MKKDEFLAIVNRRKAEYDRIVNNEKAQFASMEKTNAVFEAILDKIAKSNSSDGKMGCTTKYSCNKYGHYIQEAQYFGFRDDIVYFDNNRLLSMLEEVGVNSHSYSDDGQYHFIFSLDMKNYTNPQYNRILK